MGVDSEKKLDTRQGKTLPEKEKTQTMYRKVPPGSGKIWGDS